jgi:hypothetical protein
MNKYDRGKIYRVIAPDNAQYIGSTIDTLISRFGNHRRMYTSWKAGNLKRPCATTQLFDKYGVENCKIELIENFPCGCKKELDQREGEIIKANNCINKVVAGRSGEEYRKDKKEELNQKSRTYYEENKEKELERVRSYYKENSDARKQYEKNRRQIFTEEEIQQESDRKKKWREENADKVKEQKRKWNEANRDKINARKRELRAIKS